MYVSARRAIQQLHPNVHTAEIACGPYMTGRNITRNRNWFAAWAMIARAASPSFSARIRKSRKFTAMYIAANTSRSKRLCDPTNGLLSYRH